MDLMGAEDDGLLTEAPGAEPWTTAVPPGAAPGWIAQLRARVTEALPLSRRVVVHSQAEAQRLRHDLLRRPAGTLPDEVYFDLGGKIDEALLARLGARLLMDGTAVHFMLPENGGPPVRAEAARLGNHRVISLRSVRDGLGARVARRVLDIAGSMVLLLVLSPLLAVVAGLVWAKMGRPIFHAQLRLGRGGRLFRLYKFRSMVADAEAILRATPEIFRLYVAENFKLPAGQDPRVTPLGRFLRQTSLDELPQLWNVLRGDMSLVGPRAIVPEEVAEYGDYGRLLLRVKPGLTGLWQVSGRSTVGYPERARMDLRYVESRSLHRDLAILLRTLPAVIRQRGAI